MNIDTTFDSPKVAGLMVLASLGVLIALRKSFGGVAIRIGE